MWTWWLGTMDWMQQLAGYHKTPRSREASQTHKEPSSKKGSSASKQASGIGLLVILLSSFLFVPSSPTYTHKGRSSHEVLLQLGHGRHIFAVGLHQVVLHQTPVCYVF